MRRLIYVGVFGILALTFILMSDVRYDFLQANPDSCVVSATSNDFGDVDLDAIKYDTITVTCADDDTLYLNIAGLAAPYSFVSGNGLDTLFQDSTATVIYQYNPTAAGTHTDTIDIGEVACDNVILTGTGVAAECSLSVTDFDWRLVAIGTSRSDTVTAYNVGADSLYINVTGLSGAWLIDSGSGLDTLLADESKNVIVSFTPTTSGASYDTLVVVSGTCSVPMSAQGFTATVTRPAYLSSQDALNELYDLSLEKVQNDTTMFYSAWTGTAAAGTTIVFYQDTLTSSEYLLIQQVNAGGGISADDYLVSLHVKLNENVGETTYDFGVWGASATNFSPPSMRLITNHYLYVAPGDTIQIDLVNDDNDSDGLWYNYIIRKITF